MPTPLLSLADLQAAMGLAPGNDDKVLQAYLDGAIALLNRQCGRTAAPFASAMTARVEVLPAKGGTILVVDYPIASVAAVKFGPNFSSPDLTLDPMDPAQLRFTVGSRHLYRTDGEYWDNGVSDLLSWSRGGLINGGNAQPSGPAFVQVTYNTVDDRPADAALAVQSVVSMLYRRKGSEGVRSESLGGYSYTLDRIAADDPLWQAVVVGQLADRIVVL